ncbi:adenylyltransferase/cytidyltransferase family protein [Jatrophihabitans sp. YIM 134969]
MTVIGYAPGAFDMFHVGHLNVVRNAAARCDCLVAGVVSDALVSAAKGRTPVIDERERLAVVAAIRYVDEAVLEDVPSKVDMWHRLHFDVLFKGDDWKGTAMGDRLERDFAPWGVRIEYLPYTVHTSSTILRAALGLRTAGPHAGGMSEVG